MSEIIFDIEENCKWFGRHSGLYKIIHLWTHYRTWGDNESMIIESITNTIAHEEIHIILRSFGIEYTNREESILRRIKYYLYPRQGYILNKNKDINYKINCR